MKRYIKTTIIWTINSFDRQIWSRKLLPARTGNWNLQSLQFSIKLTLKKQTIFCRIFWNKSNDHFHSKFLLKEKKISERYLEYKEGAAIRKCSSEYVFFKILQYHRKTPVLESLFNKVASFQEEGKKRLNADVFLTMLQNILWYLLYRTPPVAAPHKKSRTNLNVHTLLPHNLQFQNRRSQ